MDRHRGYITTTSLWIASTIPYRRWPTHACPSHLPRSLITSLVHPPGGGPHPRVDKEGQPGVSNEPRQDEGTHSGGCRDILAAAHGRWFSAQPFGHVHVELHRAAEPNATSRVPEVDPSYFLAERTTRHAGGRARFGESGGGKLWWGQLGCGLTAGRPQLAATG